MSQTTQAINATDSKAILSGEGWVAGYFVNTASSMRIYHGTSNADLGQPFFNGSFTPTAGNYYSLYNMHATAGVYFRVTAGETIDVTFFVKDSD